MALIIPTQAVPAQRISVQLANQSCVIMLRQKLTGMYLDLYVNDALVIGGVICENSNRIVRNDYLGFIGDLIFIDTQGTTDPYYTGLGVRYFLTYLEVADLPVQGG